MTERIKKLPIRNYEIIDGEHLLSLCHDHRIRTFIKVNGLPEIKQRNCHR